MWRRVLAARLGLVWGPGEEKNPLSGIESTVRHMDFLLFGGGGDDNRRILGSINVVDVCVWVGGDKTLLLTRHSKALKW